MSPNQINHDQAPSGLKLLLQPTKYIYGFQNEDAEPTFNRYIKAHRGVNWERNDLIQALGNLFIGVRTHKSEGEANFMFG